MTASEALEQSSRSSHERHILSSEVRRLESELEAAYKDASRCREEIAEGGLVGGRIRHGIVGVVLFAGIMVYSNQYN